MACFRFLELCLDVRLDYGQLPSAVRFTNARPVASMLMMRSWLPASGLERHTVKVAGVASTPVE
jgi:hypothetical protein